MNRIIGTDESVSYALTCAVSEFEDRPVNDLPPLRDTLDVEALESLVCSETADSPQTGGCLVFEYSDSNVSIWLDAPVTVQVTATVESETQLKEGYR